MRLQNNEIYRVFTVKNKEMIVCSVLRNGDRLFLNYLAVKNKSLRTYYIAECSKDTLQKLVKGEFTIKEALLTDDLAKYTETSVLGKIVKMDKKHSEWKFLPNVSLEIENVDAELQYFA